MKKAVIKFPFKLQDLIIIESTRLFVDSEISIEAIDFSSTSNNYDSRNIVLGLGKEKSRVDDFLISKCTSFNERDVEYLDHLRFSNKIQGPVCVTLKSAISSLRKGILNSSNKESKSGVYSIHDIYSMLEVYTGYKDNPLEEFNKKSSIVKSWLTEIYLQSSNRSAEYINLSGEEFKSELFRFLEKKFNLSNIKSLEDFKNVDKSEILPHRLKSDLSLDIKKIMSPQVRTLHKSNLENILTKDNLVHWVNLWLESRIEFSERNSKYLDLWNSCDFSRTYAVINITDTLIADWKKLAKLEENVMFFVTPEKGSNNWSIISLKPTVFPMIESTLPYWTHVSKFLSKFDSYEKVNQYLDHILGHYSDKLEDYFRVVAQ